MVDRTQPTSHAGLPALEGPSAPPAAGGSADALVVLLHGYGADGNDLIGLAPFFAQALPNAAFHSPHAPYPCEMGPFGRQWFSLADYDPTMLRRSADTMGPVYARMAEGAAQAAPLLDSYLSGLCNQYGLPAHRLVLVGFSQGTMMSLQVGLRRTEPPACIIGFSGALLGDVPQPSSSAESPPQTRPPIHLIHGDADPVVPVQASQGARDALTQAGYSCSYLECAGLEHGIDPEGATHARTVMLNALSQK